MSKTKLYSILTIACLAGYSWLGLGLTHTHADVCLFKWLTHIPCPSCGSTRSILYLYEGRFNEALMTNPLGILIAIIMIVTPLWLFFDTISRKNTLLMAYLHIEQGLRKPKMAIPLITLICLNWIWNITKGL